MRTAMSMSGLALVFGFLVSGCGTYPPPLLVARAMAFEQTDGLVTVEVDVAGSSPTDATADVEMTLGSIVQSARFSVGSRTYSFRNLPANGTANVVVCISGGSSNGQDCGEVELDLNGDGSDSDSGNSGGSGNDIIIDIDIINGDGSNTGGDHNNTGDDNDNDDDDNPPPPTDCPSLGDLDFTGYKVVCVLTEDLVTQTVQTCQVLDSEGLNPFDRLNPCFKVTAYWTVTVPTLNPALFHSQSREDSLLAELPTPAGQAASISATLDLVARTENEQATVLTTPAQVQAQ